MYMQLVKNNFKPFNKNYTPKKNWARERWTKLQAGKDQIEVLLYCYSGVYQTHSKQLGNL